MTIDRRSLLLGLTGLPLMPGVLSAASLPRRVASGPQSRSIHSGHSLTDAYTHTGEWPGHLRRIAEDAGIPDPFLKLVRSTIPGSPMRWRWSHRVEDARPSNSLADARHDIADFDTLVITEAGPPPRLGHRDSRASLQDSLDYLCRFAANAIENGAGGRGARDIALWSIWPAYDLWRAEPFHAAIAWHDLPDLGAVLDGYGETYCYLADHASHVLRRSYPELPPDWRIWVFPGHLFMRQLWEDTARGIVPSITRFEDLFVDTIHASDDCGFGLACLMVSCLYQIDLRSRKPRVAKGMSPELRDYFAEISWQIATRYAPAGLGGAEGANPMWLAGRDEDLIPTWAPSAARL